MERPPPWKDERTLFEKALEDLINSHSMEQDSNTPDFILAQYLMACLAAWNVNVKAREEWYGRESHRFTTELPPPPPE